MLLDASQAFARVNYIKLFRLLIKKGMCPLICIFLAVTYTNQTIRSKWGNHMCPSFRVSNGVKQGRVFSPTSFEVYIDELVLRMKATGVGCNIGKCFLTALGYADDMTLLSPTKSAICFPKNLTLTSIPENASW